MPVLKISLCSVAHDFFALKCLVIQTLGALDDSFLWIEILTFAARISGIQGSVHQIAWNCCRPIFFEPCRKSIVEGSVTVNSNGSFFVTAQPSVNKHGALG